MEITLEKIELVKDRTGVSYKEAKEALEQTEGNVVDAIILIEDTIDQGSNASEGKVAATVALIKETIKKGNVSKIVIKRDEEIILNLPVNIGIVGTVIFPWAAVAGAIAALGTKCQIEILKNDGDVIDISSKVNDAFETAKSKGGVVLDEVKDKSADVFDVAKEKGKQAWDFAKEKGSDAWDFAKDKANEALKKTVDSDIIDSEELENLDLSDVDFSELEDDNE